MVYDIWCLALDVYLLSHYFNIVDFDLYNICYTKILYYFVPSTAVNITDGPNDPSPEDVAMATATTEQEPPPTNNEVISHPLEDINNIDGVRSSERLDSFDDDDYLDSSSTTNRLPSGVTKPNSSGTPPPRPKIYKPTNLAHGLRLTLSDHDRLRIFIHEFVVRGLLPYIEKMIRTLNESVGCGWLAYGLCVNPILSIIKQIRQILNFLNVLSPEFC